MGIVVGRDARSTTGILTFQYEGPIRREYWLSERLDIDEPTLEIGAQDGWLLLPCQLSNLTSIDYDFYNYEGFVQADAHKLPFKDNAFTNVVMAELLEHVEDPVQCLKEARRVGQKLLATIPDEYHWNPDAKPFDGVPTENKLEKAKQASPNCIEFNQADDLKHVWHSRYYTRDLVHDHFKQAGWAISEFTTTAYNGFAFFLIAAERD